MNVYSNWDVVFQIIGCVALGFIFSLVIIDYGNTINIHEANIRAMEVDLAKYKDGKVIYLDEKVKFILTGEK